MVETQDIMGLDEIEIQNTPIDDINSELVDLIFVAIDESGSMDGYVGDMKVSLKGFKSALLDSKEIDEMLVARANFHDRTIDVGGYKKVDSFDENYATYGNTPLYDVIVEGTKKLTDYMDYLKQQGMRVKAVFSVFSDGEDTNSRNSLSTARKCIEELNDKEIVTAFISFGSYALQEAKNLKFKNILNVGSSASELRKAFDCLSKSVIDSSKSVVPKTNDFFDI